MPLRRWRVERVTLTLLLLVVVLLVAEMLAIRPEIVIDYLGLDWLVVYMAYECVRLSIIEALPLTVRKLGAVLRISKA